MASDPVETPQIIEVADGFYVRQAVDNMAWIDMGDYAVVVDALEQPHLAGEVMAEIDRTLGGKPVRYVLNTHTHYDHVALNGAFERLGAEIVNQETCSISSQGRWFDGRRGLKMLATPGCHTSEDCCVWCPEDRALLVGDIFGWGLIPCGAVTRRTIKILDETYGRLIAFGATTVVPGHGPVCATHELLRWVDYFHWLIDAVSKAHRAGDSESQIAASLAPPEDMKRWWRFVQWKHEDSVAKVVKAVCSGELGG